MDENINQLNFVTNKMKEAMKTLIRLMLERQDMIPLFIDLLEWRIEEANPNYYVRYSLCYIREGYSEIFENYSQTITVDPEIFHNFMNTHFKSKMTFKKPKRFKPKKSYIVINTLGGLQSEDEPDEIRYGDIKK